MEQSWFGLGRKFDLFLNVFLIIVSIYIVGLLAKNYLLPIGAASKEVRVGSAAHIQGIDLKVQSKTVLLFLRSDCGYCTRSAGFYQRLLSQRSSLSRPYDVLALFSDDDLKSDAYL